MAGQILQALLHVAPFQGGFGIRVRLTRDTPGVWLGQGWSTHKESIAAAEIAGAETIPEGWKWGTREAADTHLKTLVDGVHTFGYTIEEPHEAQ